MQNTENFNLKVYDGEDLFNPLTVENVNVQAIDTQMKKNENHAVGDATELVSGTVHAITRLTPDAPMLRFTATSRFTSGDTFTVDGVQVSALTVSGEQLPDGAYIIGSEVLAYLKGTLLTVFTSQGTLATAKNALKLGGNVPEYYATESAVQTAQETANAAGNLANEVNNSLYERKQKLLWSNSNPSTEFPAQTITLSSSDYDYIDIYYKYSNSANLQITPLRLVKGNNGEMSFTDTSSNSFFKSFNRGIFYKTDTTYDIARCIQQSVNATSYIENNYTLIPLYIYSGKF